MARQVFEVRHSAAGTATAGPGTLVQPVHIQLQRIADVRLTVLLLVWRGGIDRGLDTAVPQIKSLTGAGQNREFTPKESWICPTGICGGR